MHALKKIEIRTALAALILLIGAGPAHAQLFVYAGQGPAAFWQDPFYWDDANGNSLEAVPGGGADVLLGGSNGLLPIYLGVNYTSANALNSLTVDDLSPNDAYTFSPLVTFVQTDAGASEQASYTPPGTYNMYAGTETVGLTAGGASYYTQEYGATNTVVGILDIGAGANSSGAYSLTGDATTTLSANTEILGDAGIGSFVQNGGVNTVSTNLLLGNQAGSTAAYTLESGTLTVTGTEYVGYGNNAANGDTADFTQNDSQGPTTHTVGTLDLGYGPGSVGTYELSGGTDSTLNATTEIVGDNGSGTFTQTGGVNTVSGASLILGNAAGSGAEYTLEGGTLNVANGTEFIGYGNDASSGDTADFNQNDSQSAAANNVGTLDVGYGATSIGTYELGGASDSTLNATTEIIGDAGTGTFTQNGGVNTVTGDFTLGNQAGSSGNYALSYGTLSVGGTEYIGLNGISNTFTQTGGTNGTQADPIESIVVGSQASSAGHYQLNGGSVYAVNETVGDQGYGGFYQNGFSSNTISGSLIVGKQAGSDFSYYYLGVGTLTAGTEYVGYGSASNVLMFQYDGFGGSQGDIGPTNTVGLLDVGYGPGSNATYDLSAPPGTFAGGNPTINATTEVIGDAGTGELDQYGGTNTVSGDLSVGSQTGSNGTYALSGGTLTVGVTYGVGGTEIIGSSGVGDFNQSGGRNIATELDLGEGSGGVGTYELSGDATVQLISGVENVGESGQGTFTQTGGVNTVETRLAVGDQAGSVGTYNLESGTLTLGDQGVEEIGYQGNGTFTQSGGVNNAQTLYVGEASGSHSQYNLQSGTLTADSETVGDGNATVIGDTADFNQTGGSNTANQIVLGQNTGSTGTYELSGFSTTFSVGTLYVGVNGTGVFTQGDATINNFTTLSIGSLGTYQLNGGALQGAAGTGTIVNNGLFQGHGTVNAPGGITNNAQMTVTGSENESTISGAFSNSLTGHLLVLNTMANLGAVTNYGAIKVTGSTLNIASYTGENGSTYNSDPSNDNLGSVDLKFGASYTQDGGTASADSINLESGSTLNVNSGAVIHSTTFDLGTDVTLDIDSSTMYVDAFDVTGGLDTALADIDATDGAIIYYNPADSPGFTGDYTLDGGGHLDAEVVPEPSTWALLLSGLGMVAFLQMRRRRTNMRILPVKTAMVLMGLMASARADTVLFDNGAAGTTSATIAADSNGEVPFSPEGNVFTPTVGGTVTEINFAGEYGFNDPLADSFTLSLYSTIAGAPTTSTLLGTSTLTNFSRTDSGILLGDGFNLYDYSGTLNSPFTLDAGTPYYLGIADTTAIPGYPAPGGVGVFYLAESVSPGSATALYSLGNSEVGNHFFGPTDFPVAFELSGTVVPEPSTWALMLGGLGALAFWRLRTHRPA